MSCFRKLNGQITNVTGLERPCPGQQSSNGHSPCCTYSDVCLEDNVCYYTHPQTGGSRFYTSSCTDDTYGDSEACNSACTNFEVPDIVYIPIEYWRQCCGLPNSCSRPAGVVLEAPTPDQLLAAYSLTASTSISTSVSIGTSTRISISTSTSTTVSTSTTSIGASVATASTSKAQISTATAQAIPTATNQSITSSDHLGSGAIAGIAIGSTFVVAVVVALGYWLSLQRKISAQKTTAIESAVSAERAASPAHEPAPAYSMDLKKEIHELPNTEQHGYAELEQSGRQQRTIFGSR